MIPVHVNVPRDGKLLQALLELKCINKYPIYKVYTN